MMANNQLIPKHELATMALKFMQRCELKGSEVPAFNEVMNWLAAEARENLQQQQTEVGDISKT